MATKAVKNLIISVRARYQDQKELVRARKDLENIRLSGGNVEKQIGRVEKKFKQTGGSVNKLRGSMSRFRMELLSIGFGMQMIGRGFLGVIRSLLTAVKGVEGGVGPLTAVLDGVTARFNIMAMVVVNNLMPVITWIADKIKIWIDRFANLAPWLQKSIVIFIAVAGALAVVAGTMAFTGLLLAGLKQFFLQATWGAGIFIKSLIGVKWALNEIKMAIVGIAPLIGILAAVGTMMALTSPSVSAGGMGGVSDEIKNAASGAGGIGLGPVGMAAEVATVPGIMNLLPQGMQNAVEVLNQGVTNVFSEVGQWILDFFNDPLQKLTDLWLWFKEFIWNPSMEFLSNLWVWFKESIWNPSIQWLEDVWSWFKDSIWDPAITKLEDIWNWVKGSIFDPFIGALTTIWDWVKLEIIDPIGNWFGGAIESMSSIGSSIGSFISELLGFQHGGVVPGPPGSPQMILAHGGETIRPPGMNSFSGGININISGASNPTILADQIAGILANRIRTQTFIRR